MALGLWSCWLLINEKRRREKWRDLKTYTGKAKELAELSPDSLESIQFSTSHADRNSSSSSDWSSSPSSYPQTHWCTWWWWWWFCSSKTELSSLWKKKTQHKYVVTKSERGNTTNLHFVGCCQCFGFDVQVLANPKPYVVAYLPSSVVARELLLHSSHVTLSLLKVVDKSNSNDRGN